MILFAKRLLCAFLEILKPRKARIPRTHSEPVRQLQLNDTLGLGFLPRESLVRFRSSKIPFVAPGDLKLHDATASRKKMQQTYLTAVLPLLKHKSQAILVTNNYWSRKQTWLN